MVSLITEGSSHDDKGRPFRRRRAMPILVVFAVLALLGAIVWIGVLGDDEDLATTVDCNAPQPAAQPVDPAAPPQQTLGERVDGRPCGTWSLQHCPPPRCACSTRTANTVRLRRWPPS